MNIFNRLVTILLILAVMILIPLILIFPEQVQHYLWYASELIKANLEWLNGLSPTAQIGVRLVLAAVGAAVFVIGLLFLALEVIRLRRSTVRLRDGSGTLMMDSVSSYLSYYVDLLPDVLRVRPTVRSTGKSVSASLFVETAPGVNVLEKSGEVRQTAHEVITEQLGLEVKGDIEVVIKPVPYPKATRGARGILSRPERRTAQRQAPPPEPQPVVAPEFTPPKEAVAPPQGEEQESAIIEVRGPPSTTDEPWTTDEQ
jgi:hypothetical protein